MTQTATSPIAPGVAEHHGGSGQRRPTDRDNLQHYKKFDETRRRRETGPSLSRWLVRQADDIEAVDRERRLQWCRTAIRAMKYLDGDFFGYVDSNMSWVESRREMDDEVWYSDNQIYQYWRTALMELSRTQAEVVINASVDGDEMLEEAAKFAQRRYDSIRERTFRPRIRQTENAYALLSGITYRYTFPSFEAARKGRGEKVPVMSRSKGDKTAEQVCANCGEPKPSGADPDVKEILGDEYDEKSGERCPKCSGTVFTERESDMGDGVVIGYKDLPSCENKWIVPNPIGVICSMTADSIPNSPFLKWNMLVWRSVLESRYPGIEIPSTGVVSQELQYIANQQTSTPSGGAGSGIGLTSGDGSSRYSNSDNELEMIQLEQVWLDYAVYCNVAFTEAQTFSNGKTLKAGQRLGEMFPDGIYYARIGDLIVDVWNENKNDKWTSSPYGIRPGSMYGSGSAVAMSDQDMLNDLVRLVMANAWSNGVPREFVDPDMIPELSADPAIPTNVRNPMNLPNLLNAAYGQAPATQLSAEVYALREAAAVSMQGKVGAMSGTGAGGMADQQKWGDTATAISIKRDLAVGRFSPDLELMADELDVTQAYQFLENEKKYFTAKQWERYKGDHGEEGLKAFLECDVKRDLNISIAPGSHMPKSEAQMQAKVMAYATQILPALAQIGDMEMIAFASEVFGMPAQIGGWSAERTQARRVIAKFKQLSDLFVQEYGDLPTNDLEDPMVQEVVTRLEQFANMPVDYFLDNHEGMVAAYMDERNTDDGRTWTNILTAAISGRVVQHKAGTAKQQQMMNRVALAGNEPMDEKAKADQAEQIALAQEQEAQTAAGQVDPNAQAMQDQETQLQIADKAAQYQDKEADRTHQREMQSAEHEQQARLKAAELISQQELAAQAAETRKKDSAARK